MAWNFAAADNEAIVLPSALNMPGDNDELTIDIWCRPTTPFADSRLFDKSEDLVETKYLVGMANASGRIRFDLTGTTLSAGGSNYTMDVWQHILARYDGSDMELWLNGVFDISISKTGNVPSTGDPCSIGAAALDPGSRNWNGDIGRIRLFNRALTDSEIVSIPPALGADIITTGLFYEFKGTEGPPGVDVEDDVVINSGPETLAAGSGDGSESVPRWTSMDLAVYPPAA